MNGVTCKWTKKQKRFEILFYPNSSLIFDFFSLLFSWIRSIHSWSQCEYKSIIESSADFLWKITLCSANGQWWRYVVHIRQTDRWTDWLYHCLIVWLPAWQMDRRRIARWMDRWTDRWTDIQTDVQTDRHTDGWTDGHTERQMDRQMNGQTACLMVDCSQSPILPWDCTCQSLRPPSPLPTAFCTLLSFARIKRPRWWLVKLSNWYLQSHRKIGECKQPRMDGQTDVWNAN